MKVSQAATLMRTAQRLRVSQIVMRPYARASTAVLPQFMPLRPVLSRGAIRRFRAWAVRTSDWSREATMREARRLVRNEWRYIGLTVPAVAGQLSFPSAFPSRLWEYEYRYRRWLEGLAHLVLEGDLERDAVNDVWNRSDREAVAADYEPYVLARRLWSEATAAGLLEDATRLSGIDRAMRILRAAPELHILANHLLADRASVAAICALLHPAASATAKAVADYIEELELQIDRDGLHEERSPGYHLIALHDLKRTLAAVEIAGFSDAARRLARFESSMAAAMRRLLHPDGTMPMFHDSSALASPTPSDLNIQPFPDAVSVDLSASGLCVLQNDRDGSRVRLVADFGVPRPAHQPGHQHAAPFAFELWWGGLWITSAGVSTYESGERRLFERGAAAHACVRVGEREPAEIWSAFRMGRGYEVSERRFEDSGSRVSISARHDGFAPASQRRTITLDRSSSQLTLRDEITGAGEEKVESFLPLAPDVQASVAGQTVTLAREARSVELLVTGEARLEVRPFDVALRFGEHQPSHVVVATSTGDRGITMTFSFRSAM